MLPPHYKHVHYAILIESCKLSKKYFSNTEPQDSVLIRMHQALEHKDYHAYLRALL